MTRSAPVVYLSMDELSSGVGASQVVPYVERLAGRGLEVVVHSFEHGAPSADLRSRFDSAGVRWSPHPFGRPGSIGGLSRVIRAAVALRRTQGPKLVHARSDLSAAAAMLGGARDWVWDVRSLWADQRIALGALREGSPEERLMRRIESRAASRCSGVVTLTNAVLPTLAARHGEGLTSNIRVIPTCVDLDRFPLAAMPDATPSLTLVISGSLNAYYDVPAMLRFTELSRARRPTELKVLAPGPTAWDTELVTAGASISAVRFEEMPGALVGGHAGLSICRREAGVSLRAAMPTKLGEFLATGRPVVVNRGLGDMDEVIAAHRCGVIVESEDDAELAEAVAELHSLVAEPDLAERCRRAAEAHFDIDRGVRDLVQLYETIWEDASRP